MGVIDLKEECFGSPISELTLKADSEEMTKAASFVEDTLTAADCPMEITMEFNIVVDEIFSNIYKYSCASEVKISCGIKNGNVMLRFSDDGTPYDPLQSAAPKTNAPADKRVIGGLGIHLVHELADSVTYESINGRNILTILKATGRACSNVSAAVENK